MAVRSLAGEPCRVVTDIEEPVFEGKRSFQVVAEGKDTYCIDLQKGEEVLIRRKGKKVRCEVRPVDNGVQNYYGKK